MTDYNERTGSDREPAANAADNEPKAARVVVDFLRERAAREALLGRSGVWLEDTAQFVAGQAAAVDRMTPVFLAAVRLVAADRDPSAPDIQAELDALADAVGQSNGAEGVSRALAMFVIYDHPRDFPEHVVVRRHLVGPGWTQPDVEAFAVVATVADARAAVPAGLVCLGRDPADDPKIVEVWV